jgi:tripartite-type tricarboxylate transporter receptor subunit TctC
MRCLVAILLALCLAEPAAAQTYPSRTVSLVVPYPAGGSVDGVARILAQALGERLGQSVIVENRGGGAGRLHADADGVDPRDHAVPVEVHAV